MSTSSPLRPSTFTCPIGVAMDDQQRHVDVSGEDVDPALAIMGEPMIGMDKVVYDDDTGPGAWRPNL